MSAAAGFASSSGLKRAANAARTLLRAALDIALPPLCAGLPRPGARQRTLPRLLVEAFIHHPALLRAARYPIRLRSRSRHSVDGSDSPSAGLSARPRRGALRRNFPRVGPRAQIWRPARSRADDGALACACRTRAPWRGRRARPGAAALAAKLGAALQPIGNAGGGGFLRKPACRWPRAALKRVKATVQQVGLSRSERAANIQGAFRVPAEGKAAIAGRKLVLVDDVLTSGATAEGCARALLRAGAANVDVLVFRQGCRSGANVHIKC